MIRSTLSTFTKHTIGRVRRRTSTITSRIVSTDGMGNVTADNLSNNYTYDAEGRPITAAGVQTTFDP
jgi:hypothetical protein